MTPIKDMLNRYRAQALQPVIDASLPTFLKGKQIGRISNPLGRTRLFYLDGVTKQKQASIRRQAGNFPIQSFAREIFCTAFCNLCDALKRDGLMDAKVPDDTKPLGYRFDNKVSIMAYIHDECLISVDSSVNPYYMYKLIHDNCMLQIEGHPTYYCGINIITNWYEGKSSKFEAPVRFVKKVLESDISIYRDPMTPQETRDQVLAEIREFSLSRVEDELCRIYPDADKHVYDLRKIIPAFKNYAIKPLVETHLKLHRAPKKKDNDDFVKVSIETLVLYYKYHDNTFIDLDGSVYHLDIDTRQSIVESSRQNEDKVERESDAFDMIDSYAATPSMPPKMSEDAFLQNTQFLEQFFEGDS